MFSESKENQIANLFISFCTKLNEEVYSIQFILTRQHLCLMCFCCCSGKGSLSEVPEKDKLPNKYRILSISCPINSRYVCLCV